MKLTKKAYKELAIIMTQAHNTYLNLKKFPHDIYWGARYEGLYEGAIAIANIFDLDLEKVKSYMRCENNSGCWAVLMPFKKFVENFGKVAA